MLGFVVLSRRTAIFVREIQWKHPAFSSKANGYKPSLFKRNCRKRTVCLGELFLFLL